MGADVRVLHVLPHPGGGGETYCRLLDALPGYTAERKYIAPSPRLVSALGPAGRSILDVARRAHRYDILHVHGEVVAGLCLPALVARSSVVTLHGLNLLRRATGVRAIAARANLHLVIRGADRTICVSEAELDEIRGVSPGLSAKCALVPYGVPLPAPPTNAERQVAREALAVDEGTVVVLWIGSLDRPKQPVVAVEAALDAVRRGAALRLAMLGDGPLRPAVEKAASELPGVVTFHGHRGDTRPFLAAADLFVLASQREGLPFALLEAMAMGLAPVVAVGVGGVEHAVEGAGLSVRHGDRDGLPDALLALVRSAELRARLGEAARARVAERYTLERMLGQTQQIYEQVRQGRQVTRVQ
jgi:glycosyltransferase involved in cell wall biosynthesis